MKIATDTQFLKLLKYCYIKSLYYIIFGKKNEESTLSYCWLPDQNLIILTFLSILH